MTGRTALIYVSFAGVQLDLSFLLCCGALRQDDLLDFTFLQAFKQGLADDKVGLLYRAALCCPS